MNGPLYSEFMSGLDLPITDFEKNVTSVALVAVLTIWGEDYKKEEGYIDKSH